jgi:outer membrane assembly lipoprotein YfgL
MTNQFAKGLVRAVLALAAVFILSACASGSVKPKPADLGPDPASFNVRLVWSSKIGSVDFPLQVKVNGQNITIASSDGVMASVNASTGVDLWRANVGAALSAGVGSDGHFSSVVTRSNELVVFENGSLLWRAQLGSQVFTSPLVAGERVFVLGADRSLAAFDAKSGRRLWRQQRAGDALVLRQSGILMTLGNTLLVGQSGHLTGVNPANGNVVWDAPVATPRGTNDIERLADLVSGVSRQGNAICVRAFQTAVGCVDGANGAVNWKKAASGAVGLVGDDSRVYGVEEDGRMLAWKHVDGEVVWTSDRLRYRSLTTPLVLGRSVVVGDDSGQIHFLARTDGMALKRLSTDGSAINATPVDAKGTLVVVTRQGGVFGFQPE